MAIKDALQLSKLLAEAASSGLRNATLQSRLEQLQDEVTKRGAAIVQMSRDAVLGPGGSANPANPANSQKSRGWGFEMSPIAEST